VCDALAHAHRKNVFHRDIKPTNILVRLPDETVKVADWGVAKNIEMDGVWEGSIVGTRPYMPPEVLARMDLYSLPDSKEPAKMDHRADIYSLGATVFRIVTGKHPFKNPNEIGNAAHRASQEQVLAGAIGAPLAAAIMKAIEHDADKRYNDAKEFSQALEQNLERPTGPLVSAPAGAAPTMAERLEEASAIVRGGNSDGSAESRYQAIISDYPREPRPYLDYARFCAAYRTHEDTLRVLTAGIDLTAPCADLYFQRGRIYRAVGKVKEAITDLKEALRIGLDAEKIVQAERLLARLEDSGTVSRA
jgi:serine/threonine protein kinase